MLDGGSHKMLALGLRCEVHTNKTGLHMDVKKPFESVLGLRDCNSVSPFCLCVFFLTECRVAKVKPY